MLVVRLALVLATTLSITACAANPSPASPAAASPAGGVIVLRTSPPESMQSPPACPAALTTGVLVRHPQYGVGLRYPAGNVSQVIWPSGYVARDDGGRLALVDGSGSIVAHEGDTVQIGGGEISKNTWLGCGGITVVAP